MGVAVIGFDTPICSMYVWYILPTISTKNYGKMYVFQIQSHGAYMGTGHECLAIFGHSPSPKAPFPKGFSHHDDVTPLFFWGGY